MGHACTVPARMHTTRPILLLTLRLLNIAWVKHSRGHENAIHNVSRRTGRISYGGRMTKQLATGTDTANLRTNIMDFREFDSSRILILRGGTLMSIGNSLESLSQAILVGIMLVGRLGVPRLLMCTCYKPTYHASCVCACIAHVRYHNCITGMSNIEKQN